MIMLCLVPRLVLELIGRLALVFMEGSRGEVHIHVSRRTKTGIVREGRLDDTKHMGVRHQEQPETLGHHQDPDGHFACARGIDQVKNII